MARKKPIRVAPWFWVRDPEVAAQTGSEPCISCQLHKIVIVQRYPAKPGINEINYVHTYIGQYPPSHLHAWTKNDPRPECLDHFKPVKPAPVPRRQRTARRSDREGSDEEWESGIPIFEGPGRWDNIIMSRMDVIGEGRWVVRAARHHRGQAEYWVCARRRTRSGGFAWSYETRLGTTGLDSPNDRQLVRNRS